LLKQSNNISVVIPAYNAEKSIQRTLKSLHDQSFKSFEIIVVDDGSADRTADIAKPLASKVIKTENRGPAAARNTGIQHASGEIIALIDSDCQAEKTWVESISRVFADTEVSVIMGEVIIPMSNFVGDAISALGFPAGGSIGFDKVWKVTSEGYTNTLSTCNCAFRKEIFNKFGPFNEDFRYAGGEDTLFAARIVKAGIKIKYCQEVKVLHEPRTSLVSFMRWQVQRGKCALEFKRKIGNVSSFAKMRLWSTKNVIMTFCNDRKFPLILLLIFLSYVLQSFGFLIAYGNCSGRARRQKIGDSIQNTRAKSRNEKDTN
jgi:glycosyltransferase involved in cell wall biosynthesis